MGGIDIDHRRAAVGSASSNSRSFASGILERRMVVEMIARQIGEGARARSDAVEPALLEPVARGLERQMRDPLAASSAERLVKLDRIGVVSSRDLARRRLDAERAEARRRMPARPRSAARTTRPRSCRWCR